LLSFVEEFADESLLLFFAFFALTSGLRSSIAIRKAVRGLLLDGPNQITQVFLVSSALTIMVALSDFINWSSSLISQISHMRLINGMLELMPMRNIHDRPS